MVVLDSDILIALIRGEEQAFNTIKHYYDRGDVVLTTSITTFELFKGASLSDHPEKKITEVETLIGDLDVLDFDTQSSKLIGKVYSRLKKKGILIDILDLFISGIVISNNETLVTRNIKQFSRISGLKIEKW